MAWTNVGFDGTINEAQWASLAGLLGNGYIAAGNGDCLATAVPGARSVSVAAGSLYGDGILSTNSAPETVAMTTPVNGQWYVIALRRTWATNTAALVAIAGATTTTTTPTAPPTSFPTLNTNVGVLTDQPIAWAWCNSANTTVVVYDIRLKAVKSLPPVVANGTERDAKFMTPSQGLQVWRDDLGAVETYFGLYNASTNPGGRDTAGWYVNNRASGLVPIRPTTATIATGTGSANSMGVVSFSGATSVSLNGVFSAEYVNYRVIFDYETSVNTANTIRLRVGGTDDTSVNYVVGRTYQDDNTGGFQNTSGSSAWGTTPTGSVRQFVGDMIILRPFLTTPTAGWHFGAVSATKSSGAKMSSQIGNHLHQASTSFDGITLIPNAGTMTGTIQVFGFND